MPGPGSSLIVMRVIAGTEHPAQRYRPSPLAGAV